MKRIAAITLNWKKYELTERCLMSLKASNYPVDIYLADNESVGDNLTKLQHFCEKTYPFKTNRGFAYPNNLIAKKIAKNYDLLLFINNDTVVEATAVEELLDAYEELGPNCAVQPLLVDYDVPNIIQSAGFISAVGSKYGGFRYEGKSISTVKNDFLNENHLYGACFLIAANDFVEIGGFDEEFYYQMEDIDLGERLKKQLNYKFYVAPRAVVRHKAHGSEALRGTRHGYYWTRNFARYLSRKYKPLRLIFIISAISLLIPFGIVSIISPFIKGQYDGLLDFLKSNFGKSKNYL